MMDRLAFSTQTAAKRADSAKLTSLLFHKKVAASSEVEANCLSEIPLKLISFTTHPNNTRKWSRL